VAERDSFSEARQLWDRLIGKPWANPRADFDDVMSKLAANWWVDELLVSPEWAAKSPYRPPLSPIPPGDRYMIDELRALARQPFEEMPWPDPPEVDLERLASDYERSTGQRVGFAWHWDQLPYGGFWQVELLIGGSVVGGCGAELVGDPEQDLVALTDRLQSEHLGEEFEGDWPKCHYHSSVVMVPRTDGVGIASWVCQVDPNHAVRIGSLGVNPY
jgi:hypothetical protein